MDNDIIIYLQSCLFLYYYLLYLAYVGRQIRRDQSAVVTERWLIKYSTEYNVDIIIIIVILYSIMNFTIRLHTRIQLTTNTYKTRCCISAYHCYSDFSSRGKLRWRTSHCELMSKITVVKLLRYRLKNEAIGNLIRRWIWCQSNKWFRRLASTN